MAQLAARHGFALAGGEALQFGGGPGPPGPPVPADCVACFKRAGCVPGPYCVNCCQSQFMPCSAVCQPEHVPFPAAVAAVCGLDEGVAMEEEEWPDGWNGGQWLIPEIQTDETGIKCDVQTERDAAYIVNAIKSLEYLGVNTSAIFFTGCSMGSAMTVWIAQCMHKRTPAAVSAFASQSTGLKVKGDGLRLPPDNYNPQYSWGECPKCEYFPSPVVKTDGLKACVVDQYNDFDFYKSSLQLNRTWHPMRGEIDLHPGGHCMTRSYEWVVECLDDGTGRLLGGR